MFRLTRRELVQAAIAAATVAAAPRPAAAARFSYMPAAFDVTSRSALAWLRVSGRARVRFEYGTDPSFKDAAVTPTVAVSSDTDYTAVIDLTGLQPDTEYVYRGVIVDDGNTGAPGRFRTAAEVPKEFRFGWSADLESGHQPFRLLERVVERRPDLFLLLGDLVYADVPKDRFDPSLRFYRFKQRENRDDKRLQRLLAAVPVAAIWDDHEVQNNFDSTHPALAAGRQAFREYWPVRTPDARTLYRRLAWGPAADFFVLDCRSYRSPQSDGDGPHKTMLGAEQKAWLKDALTASTATFKFLATSVPFLGRFGPDTWGNYAHEQAEMRGFLRGIKNLVVLSGDLHMAFDMDRDGIREFIAGPVAAWPQCKMNASSEARLRGTGRFFLCDAFNYGLVTVKPVASPPVAEVEIVDARGAVRHRAVLTAT